MNRQITFSITIFFLLIISIFIWSAYDLHPIENYESNVLSIIDLTLEISHENQVSYIEDTSAILYSRVDLEVILVVSLVIGIMTIILIKYLIYIQKQHVLQITQGLKGNVEIENLAFKSIEQELNEKSNRHLLDYQRLQTYLSHEQKNVLAVLRTDLERANQKELLKKVDRLSENIDDVLTLSDSVESSNKIELDIALVAASVCDAYIRTYPNIVFDFEEEAELTILGKERWIYRAVSNILDNAIKYGENNPIFVSVIRKNNSIILAVKDRGIGIESYALTKIFEAHFRVNELHKDGYGIGLSLVAHVCDLCEGTVWVDSEKGMGSTFYLSFPAAKV